MRKWCGDLEYQKIRKDSIQWQKESTELLTALYEERNKIEKLLEEVQSETFKNKLLIKGIKQILKGDNNNDKN